MRKFTRFLAVAILAVLLTGSFAACDLFGGGEETGTDCVVTINNTCLPGPTYVNIYDFVATPTVKNSVLGASYTVSKNAVVTFRIFHTQASGNLGGPIANADYTVTYGATGAPLIVTQLTGTEGSFEYNHPNNGLMTYNVLVYTFTVGQNVTVNISASI
jgi:hypothetical protein